MKKILESTETTGQPFRAPGGVFVLSNLMEQHAGGTLAIRGAVHLRSDCMG